MPSLPTTLAVLIHWGCKLTVYFFQNIKWCHSRFWSTPHTSLAKTLLHICMLLKNASGYARINEASECWSCSPHLKIRITWHGQWDRHTAGSEGDNYVKDMCSTWLQFIANEAITNDAHTLQEMVMVYCTLCVSYLIYTFFVTPGLDTKKLQKDK